MNVKFLICLLWGVCIIGCTSKDKNAETVVPKNFERAIPPAIMTAQEERAGYMATHFWDRFNFRDTMYCYVPDLTEQAFSDFVFYLQNAPYNQACAGIKKLLDSASIENVMYDYFCQKAEHYLYHPHSPQRNDELYIPFLEHIIASPKIEDESKIRFQYQLDLAIKNRPGNKALDFTYTLYSGTTGCLYDVIAKYTALIFYDPDCGGCQDVIAIFKNSPIISTAISSGKLKIVALYSGENIDTWKEHRQDFPSTWINGYDKTLTVKNEEIYDLKTKPTLYLLDKDKKVIFKDTSTDKILEYLDKNS